MQSTLRQTSQQELCRHKYPPPASAEYRSAPQLYKSTKAVLPHVHTKTLIPQKAIGGHSTRTK